MIVLMQLRMNAHTCMISFNCLYLLICITGSFENYLEMDQKDFEADTNARVQYKTAMIMKDQRAREKRKKVGSRKLHVFIL